MATYEIAFLQTHCYEIEADSEEEAYNETVDEFYRDMCEPTANTEFDDYCIEEVDEDGNIKMIKPFDSFN